MGKKCGNKKMKFRLWCVIMLITLITLFINGVMPLDNLLVNSVFIIIIASIIVLALEIIWLIMGKINKNRRS